MNKQSTGEPSVSDESEFEELIEILSLKPQDDTTTKAIQALRDRTALGFKLLAYHRTEIESSIKVPEKWKRCEITGLVGEFDKFQVMTRGKVSVNIHRDGRISIFREESYPPSKEFPNIIREIKERQPQVEIHFEF